MSLVFATMFFFVVFFGGGVLRHLAVQTDFEFEISEPLVKPRTLGREVLGSSSPITVRCGLEQVTYPQLLR